MIRGLFQVDSIKGNNSNKTIITMMIRTEFYKSPTKVKMTKNSLDFILTCSSPRASRVL